MKKKFLLLLLLVSPTIFVNAQDDATASNDAPVECVNGENGWCWGNDPETAKEKYAVYNDAFKMKDYATSKPGLDWLLENTPNLNKSIYINGIKLYEALEKEEKDATAKAALQDKVIDLYYARIKYFGEEAKNKQRLGGRAYNYWKKRDKEVYQPKMLDLYGEIFELNGNKTNRTNLTFWMVNVVGLRAKALAIEKTIDNYQVKKDSAESEAVAAAYQKKIDEYKEKDKYKEYEEKYQQYSESWILDIYSQITETIDANIAEAKGDDKVAAWKKTQDGIDGLLAKVFVFDCAFVEKNMSDDIKNKPEDAKVQKSAIKYMLNGKCTDNPLFIIAAKNLNAIEPDKGLTKIIANDYLKKEDYENAILWKEKAIELTGEDPAEQAELTLGIAKIQSKLGKKSDARATAKKSLEFDESMKSDVYSLIGNLYMTSGKQCTDSNPVKARAVYLAAYDAYSIAGNNSGMAQARAQFPSITDIFSLGMKEGETLSVGCWIGGSTTIRKRPSE